MCSLAQNTQMRGTLCRENRMSIILTIYICCAAVEKHPHACMCMSVYVGRGTVVCVSWVRVCVGVRARADMCKSGLEGRERGGRMERTARKEGRNHYIQDQPLRLKRTKEGTAAKEEGESMRD